MKFGTHIRKLRLSRGVGLRRMAEGIGISPTYLSKIERNQLPPPAETRVVALADALEQDRDVLLALAGRVASDISEIIMSKPGVYAPLIRLLDKSRAA